MTKILYVEDEPFLSRIVKESLESRGFTVELVGDGAEAVAAFERFQPDIAVLDIMLPNVDGYELGQQLRRLDATLPIIFLTAKTQTDDVLKGFQSGGNDYIRKPFSMEELIVRIKNLMLLAQNRAVGNPSVAEGFAIGKYHFLPQKYELRLGEELRRLSHREMELLKILCENRNFTVERKEVLLKIWGDDSFFNSRNLDVYITKLRDYLKADPSVNIMTVKGVGYHFSTD
jgi:two-component system, OmpR family, response regulator VicR